MKYLIILITTFILTFTNLYSQSCAPEINDNNDSTNHKIEITIRSLNGDSLNTYICSANNNGGNNYLLSCDLSYLTSIHGNDIYFDYVICNGNSPNCIDCYYNSDGSKTALPIELKLFEVRNKGIYNEIKWITLSERNNDYFTLERSVDGINWVTITTISGGGTTNSENNYLFNDYTFDKVINYYRLSQTDYDGTSEIFNIISIDNRYSKEILKVVNFIGQEIDIYSQGLKIIIYTDGTSEKVY